jgi:hypothetical protein
MIFWLRIFLLLAVIAGGVQAQTVVRLAGDVELPLPDNWYLATDTLEFPIQLVYYNDSAEILLFKSELRGDDAMRDETELKGSVDLVVNDVIKLLPDGQLFSSTGFYDVYRTGFVLEFGSSDSASGTPLRHSLKSVIYRHSDDYQIMFTIWGKATAGLYPDVIEAVKQVQTEFIYSGPYQDEVFVPAAMSYWMLAMLAFAGLALLGLIMLRPKQPRKPDHV